MPLLPPLPLNPTPRPLRGDVETNALHTLPGVRGMPRPESHPRPPCGCSRTTASTGRIRSSCLRPGVSVCPPALAQVTLAARDPPDCGPPGPPPRRPSLHPGTPGIPCAPRPLKVPNSWHPPGPFHDYPLYVQQSPQAQVPQRVGAPSSFIPPSPGRSNGPPFAQRMHSESDVGGCQLGFNRCQPGSTRRQFEPQLASVGLPQVSVGTQLASVALP